MKITQIFFVLVLSVSLISCDKERFIEADKLPKEIRNYIDAHFSESTVLQAERDRDVFDKTFEVYLSNDVHLEFNRKEEIIDIDGSSKLPDSVIPSSLRNYVSAQYPTNVITDWELDDNRQKVGLDSGVELVFNTSGSYIGRD